ncbi:MAG: CidA/LrgA family protein [Alistipes sp.]|nr:CidA/LrgA family protein [Alistipes sp.]
MKGLAIILGIYFAGEVISWLTAGFLPAGVAGMILLFAALRTGLVKGGDVKGVCRFLLDNLMLFFVPVSVGLMTVRGFTAADILPLALVLAVPVVVVLYVSGIVVQKWRSGKGAQDE